MSTNGTQISDMTDVPFEDAPDEASTPWVVEETGSGFSALSNYRTPLLPAIRDRPTFGELAAPTGAELIGTGTDETLADFRSAFHTIIYLTDSRAEILAKIAAANATATPTIFFNEGTYSLGGIETTATNMRVYGLGRVRITKDQNGPIWRHTGDFAIMNGLSFYGVGGTYTGSNLVFEGTECQFWCCGSRDAEDYALDAWKQVKIYGSNPIWHTLNAHGIAIKNGRAGGTTLYSQFLDVYTSSASSGLLFLNCGSQIVKGGQIGKYTVSADNPAAPLAGTNGGVIDSTRIINDVTIDVSNAIMGGCLIETGTITFGEFTSGISMDPSNTLSPAVIVNNLGNNANYIARNTGTEDGANGIKIRYGASAPVAADATGGGAEMWILPSADGMGNYPTPEAAVIFTPGYWRAQYARGYRSVGSDGTTLLNIAVVFTTSHSVQFGHSVGTSQTVISAGTGGVTTTVAGTAATTTTAISFLPTPNNTLSLGGGSNRWTEVFATNGTINTSDAEQKQDIGEIPDEWLDAWGDVRRSRFKMKDAVERKKGRARWHVGLVAQQVRDAFADRGLDAQTIGLLCYDEWEAQDEESSVISGEGGEETVVTRPAREAGHSWGLRYTECEEMEAAWNRRNSARLEARIAQLEAA